MKGYVGEDDGQHITQATKIIFEWQHVRRFNGDHHLVHISYHDLISHGRSIPNSPLRLAGRPGLVYTAAFFEAFAANTSPSLQYCGVM